MSLPIVKGSEAAAMKTTTVCISTWEGGNVYRMRRRTVPLLARCKGLGVTPGQGRDNGCFCVTHLASGALAFNPLLTERAARRVMRVAAKMFDWTVSSPRPGKHVLALLQNVYSEARRREDRHA